MVPFNIGVFFSQYTDPKNTDLLAYWNLENNLGGLLFPNLYRIYKSCQKHSF